MPNNTFENLMGYFLHVFLVERRRKKKKKLVCKSKDKVQAGFLFVCFSGNFCASYFGMNFLAGWIKESQDKVGKMSGKGD